MKPLYLMTVSALAATGLAACTATKPPVARASLDCPQVQGDLTRASQAADGRSCLYRTPSGGEVELRLVATGGDPQGALRAIETSLMAPIEQAQTAASEAADAAAQASEAGAKAEKAGVEAARAADEAAQDATDMAAGDGENVAVHLPGVHVESHGDGGKETARISLPGVRIVADESNDSADIQVGGMHIQAKDETATIRMWKDVRLRGEALSRQKRGLRATFIYTGKQLPGDYGLVGYEAGGPKAGPLAVAIVRAPSDGDSHYGDGDVMKDIKRLVRRNGGV